MNKIGERLVFKGKELSFHHVDVMLRGHLVKDFEVIRALDGNVKRHTFVCRDRDSHRILVRKYRRAALDKPVLELINFDSGETEREKVMERLRREIGAREGAEMEVCRHFEAYKDAWKTNIKEVVTFVDMQGVSSCTDGVDTIDIDAHYGRMIDIVLRDNLYVSSRLYCLLYSKQQSNNII